MQLQDAKTDVAMSSGSVHSDDNTDTHQSSLFFVEELADDLIKKFNAQQLQPYLKSVYADLVLRSPPAKDPRNNSLIDKVTLVEFTSLPGILSDRFCILAGSNPK